MQRRVRRIEEKMGEEKEDRNRSRRLWDVCSKPFHLMFQCVFEPPVNNLKVDLDGVGLRSAHILHSF